jgi:hypothetical protein
MSVMEASRQGHGWRRWIGTFFASGLILAGLLFGFAIALDPFGLRVTAGRPAQPLMDINQRFMYPQLVRSGAFDSAVIGTSTMRLLDPAILSSSIGGHFANLAMNAATPWEQYQMAKLFVGATPSAKAVIWGLDLPWCAASATAPENRLTPRPFPPWLYDAPSWTDMLRQMNLTTLEVAFRLLGHRFGLQPERIRGDGYEVFTPPEASYDLARARSHLFADRGGIAPDLTPLAVPAVVPASVRAGWRFPALAWLDEALSALPKGALKLIVLPPTHAAGLPRPGSADAQFYDACKDALGVLAARQGAVLVDYAHISSVTRADENYWDPLHFRLPIARRVEADLTMVAKGESPPSDGVVKVLRPSKP